MVCENVLQMKSITKRFPGVLALDKVDLELKRGEVLALLGENGAGKSTLIKILSGAYIADEGEIVLEGKTVKYSTPKEALDLGVSIIYQELNYLESLSIAENIFLGQLPVKRTTKNIDWNKLKKDTRAILDQLNLKLDSFTKVSKLSVAERQLVEIGRALSRKMKILVMDEPTSALNDLETENLFKIIKSLSEQGISIIYISHRLDEVFRVSHRVMVMRDGKRVGMLNTSETNKEELVRLMVGREIKDMYPKQVVEQSDVVLRVNNISTDKIKDISFEVRGGELLGIFGLMGSGRTNLVEAIFGIREIKKGNVEINGKKVIFKNPREAITAGLAYVPNERKTAGLILCHSVKQNITLTYIDELRKGLIMDKNTERNIAKKWVEKLNIKTPSIETITESLSGGNQQKIVLAKWMVKDTKVLFLNEPTRGIDVGAKVEIYKLMEELCRNGIAVVMLSSELPEILALSDRVIVLHEGEISGIVSREEASQATIMNYAVGGVR